MKSFDPRQAAIFYRLAPTSMVPVDRSQLRSSLPVYIIAIFWSIVYGALFFELFHVSLLSRGWGD